MNAQNEDDMKFNELVQRVRNYIPEYAYLVDIALLCKQQRRLLNWSKLPPDELSDYEKQQLLDLPLINKFLQ